MNHSQPGAQGQHAAKMGRGTETRLLLGCLGCLLLLACATWWGSLLLRQENQQNDIRRDLSLLSEQIGRSTTLHFQALRALAANGQVRALAEGTAPPDDPTARAALDAVNAAAHAELVWIMGRDGIVRSSSAYQGGTLAGVDYSFRPYFQGSLKGGEVVFPALGAKTNTRGLYLSAPIRGAGGGEPVGVAALKIGIEELDEALRSRPGFVAVVSPDGVVFSTNRPEWLFATLRPLSEEARARFASTRQFGEVSLLPLPVKPTASGALLDGRPHFTAGQELSIPGWVAVSYQPEEPDYPLSRLQKALLLGSLGVSGSLVLLIGWLALTIERRRRSEKALAASEERYRTLFEHSLEGIFQSSPEGRYLRVNSSMAQILGYDSPQDLLDGVTDISSQVYVRPSARREFTEALDRSTTGVRRELKFRRKDGSTIWAFVSARPVRDEGGDILFYEGFLLDITPQKLARQELERLNETLEQAVRDRTADLTAAYNELEAFSYSVSHDLRAPLRALDGFSLALLEDHRDRLDEDGRDCLDRIRRASQRMSAIIDDLQHLARVTRAEMQRRTFDFSALVREILEAVRAEDPDREVDTAVADGLTAFGDPDLLRLLLENLLRNAWKFTTRSKAPRIEFGAEPGAEPEFFVRDNGVGFDMAYAHKLFVAFNRLHSPDEFEGSGIGLSIVHRVVQRHGGQVRAESAPGQGAIFFFTLPGSGTQERGGP